jgi:hypothetical protein
MDSGTSYESDDNDDEHDVWLEALVEAYMRHQHHLRQLVLAMRRDAPPPKDAEPQE